MKADKIFGLFLSLLFILGVSGCNNKTNLKPVETSTDLLNTQGNSISNSYNSTDSDIYYPVYFYEDRDSFYYVNKRSLYKQSSSGKDEVILDNKIFSGFLVDGEWIYYSNSSDNNKLYKVKRDGSNNLKLSDEGTYLFYISKEYIYYNSIKSGNIGIFRIDKNGESRLKLCNDKVYHFTLGPGDWIYYNSESEALKPYRIGMDGKEKTLISTKYTPVSDVDKNFIYYIDLTGINNCSLIKKIRPDGSNDTIIARIPKDNNIYDFKHHDGYIYLRLSDESLWKLKTDGTEFKKLSKNGEHVKGYYFSRNGIYYSRNFYYPKHYRINLETRKEEEVKNFSPMEVESLGEYVVFSDIKNSLSLTISKRNGDKQRVLYRGQVHSLKTDRKVIYFLATHGDGDKLYSINADGTNLKLICDDRVANYTISGNWIYYYSNKSKSLNKVDKSGKGRTSLSNLIAKKIGVVGEWVYFSAGDNNIYRVKNDGSLEEEITSVYSCYNDFIMSDGYFYYIDSENTIQKKLANSKKEIALPIRAANGEMLYLKDKKLYSFTIVSEGIEQYSKTSAIYSTDINTCKFDVVVEGIISNWDFAENDLYFHRVDIINNWIYMNLDGKEHRVIDIKKKN